VWHHQLFRATEKKVEGGMRVIAAVRKKRKNPDHPIVRREPRGQNRKKSRKVVDRIDSAERKKERGLKECAPLSPIDPE